MWSCQVPFLKIWLEGQPPCRKGGVHTMLLLPDIWTAIHVKWKFIIFFIVIDIFNCFRTMKPESTSKDALFEINSLILFSFIFFFYVILKHKLDWYISKLLLFFFRYILTHLLDKKHTWKKNFSLNLFIYTRVYSCMWRCDQLSLQLFTQVLHSPKAQSSSKQQIHFLVILV